ncbi:unannotated protein [freshwater metagenome]|uniref:Unannotated protein n=1 Tax=freshwater metagenome TaxID=449393 RepID=A0A6J6JFY7_9ZZZZ
MSRTLGGDEDDVDAFGRFDVPKADVESVAKEKRFARGEVWENVGLIEMTLVLVGGEDDDDVRPLCRFGCGKYGESRLFRLLD